MGAARRSGKSAIGRLELYWVAGVMLWFPCLAVESTSDGDAD
jgi:hypothetical protein